MDSGRIGACDSVCSRGAGLSKTDGDGCSTLSFINSPRIGPWIGHVSGLLITLEVL